MDIFELNELKNIRETIEEVKEIVNITKEETKQETVNKVLDLIQKEINFQDSIAKDFRAVVILENLYDKVLDSLFYKEE